MRGTSPSFASLGKCHFLPSLSLPPPLCCCLFLEMEIHDFGKQQNGKKGGGDECAKGKKWRGGGFVRGTGTIATYRRLWGRRLLLTGISNFWRLHLRQNRSSLRTSRKFSPISSEEKYRLAFPHSGSCGWAPRTQPSPKPIRLASQFGASRLSVSSLQTDGGNQGRARRGTISPLSSSVSQTPIPNEIYRRSRMRRPGRAPTYRPGKRLLCTRELGLVGDGMG